MNEKTVSLCIRCGKVTANLLKAAMVKALAKMEQEKKQQGQKQPQKEKEDKTYKGKQSLDKLMKQNVQLSNIEITDGNIKSFERVAKKYSIDFSLKKDVTADPPRYYVFFKARDADVMTAAFKEYTGQTLNKDKKPSVRKKLQQAITKSLAKHRELEKTKGEGAVIMSRLQKLLGVGKGYLERLPPVDVHKLLRIVLMNLPYIVIFYVGNKLAWLYQYCVGDSMIERLMVLVLNFQMAFSRILPSMHKNELLVGITGAVAVKLLVYMKGKNAKKFRQGVEYGSARWGTAKDIAPFIDPVFENNILLTMTERLTMNGRPKNPKFARNKNVIVIGGSGSGKTRFYVKPNLMQMGKYISYVVTDPKGTIIIECGKMLVRHGYKVKVLNTINFSKSMHYNPFHYIHSEKDILKLVNTIMVNTKGEGEKSSEDFWTKAERLLYCALIGYIWYEAPEEEQNFATLLEFINASETREDDETFKNAVDMLFEELEKEESEHFAVRQYKKYKLAAGKTAKSILISCGARLAPFDIAELREIMSYDEMELDMVGDQRTALFIIISDTDDTFNFVVAMMYSQLFNLLCDRADDVHHGRLPYHVRILCDEFANIGQIPKFDKLIATIRSREISASIILQSQSQLKTIYKDAAETILGNCDTMLFLGGKESSTLKEISETLGKETIDLYNTSDTRGQSRSYGMNYQKTGKELMSRDELAVMDGSKCILQLRGVRPFFSDKFDITKHKRYKELSDYDKKNEFDVEAYMRHRMEVKLTRTQEFDLYELSEESLAGELNTENKEAEHVKDSDT